MNIDVSKNKRKIDMIVVHCTASTVSGDAHVKDVDRWHREKGWNGIGYHYLINRQAKVELGRPVEKAGAHAEGYNAKSIGVVLVGGVAEDGKTAEYNYTLEMMETLRDVLVELKSHYPDAKVLGHRELPNVHKECPCFIASHWWDNVKDTK